MAAGDSARAEAERVQKKIETLQAYLDAQQRGALGERLTADALSSLGSAWVQFHDLRWPGRRLANIDHVVVGPGGIFVIDSKNWSGRVTTHGDVLRQNGYNRERAVAGAAEAALAVAELAGPYASKVHAALCFVGQPAMRGCLRDVLLCSDDTLVHMLTSRRPVLSAEQVLDAATRLDAQTSAATDVVTTPTFTRTPVPAPAQRSRSRSTARTSRESRAPSPSRGLRRLLVGLLLVGAFIFAGIPAIAAVRTLRRRLDRALVDQGPVLCQGLARGRRREQDQREERRQGEELDVPSLTTQARSGPRVGGTELRDLRCAPDRDVASTAEHVVAEGGASRPTRCASTSVGSSVGSSRVTAVKTGQISFSRTPLGMVAS